MSSRRRELNGPPFNGIVNRSADWLRIFFLPSVHLAASKCGNTQRLNIADAQIKTFRMPAA